MRCRLSRAYIAQFWNSWLARSSSIEEGAGNDTLRGGIGEDYLEGGAGNDTYLWGPGDGIDTINDYDATDRDNPTHADRLVLPEDVSYEDLWFSRSGNHLQISVEGPADLLTVNNWFSSAQYQVERIEAGSSVLINNQVDQLVAAMAAYGAPSTNGNIIPQEVKDALQPVLAEAWIPLKD